MSETMARRTPTLESILDLNALPWTLREQIYVRLCPEELLARFGVNRSTLLNGAGERTLRIAAPDEGSWARVELRDRCPDRDPVLVVDIAMSAFGVPELTFVQINDPAAPRYAVDRDPGGPLHRLLDDSTPFRRRGFDATVRGRSWAIHDGILDAAATSGWSGVKMYRVPGRPAAVSTFPGGTY